MGVFTLQAVYSIWMTRFLSVNTFFALSILYLILLRQKFQLTFFQKWQSNILKGGRYFLFGIFLFIVFMLLNIHTFTDLFSIRYFDLYCDIPMYASYAEQMNASGIETELLNWYDYKTLGMSTYHFQELWLTALITKLFSLKAIFSYQCIYLGLFYTTSVLGALSILEQITCKRGIILIIAALSVLFVSGTSFYIPDNPLIIKGSGYLASIYDRPRIFFQFTMVLYITYLFLEKNNKYAGLLFLTLPFLNIGCAPFVYITFFFITLYNLVQNKFDFKKTTLEFYVSIPILMLFFVYILVVKLNGTHTMIDKSTDSSILGSVFEWNTFKTAFNCFAGMGIRVLLINLLLICGFLYTGWGNNQIRAIVAIACLSILAGNISYANFYRLYDGIQLFYLAYYTALPILFLILFSLLLKKNWSILKLAIIVYILIIFNQNYITYRGFTIDVDFAEKCLEKVPTTQARFACLDYFDKEGSIVNKNVHFIRLSYFKYFYNNFNPIVLNVFDVPYGNSLTDLELKKSFLPIYPVSLYVESHNKTTSNTDYMYDYLKEYHINYLFADKRVSVPLKIQRFITDSVITTSQDYRFYCLDI